MPYITGTAFVGTNLLSVLHGPFQVYHDPPYYYSVALQNMGTSNITALVERGIDGKYGTIDGTFYTTQGSAAIGLSNQGPTAYPLFRVRWITSGTLSGTMAYAIQY